MRFNPADFPQSGHWQRTVALANREITHAVKRQTINLRQVVAILDAEDKCRAYLKAPPTAGAIARADLAPGSAASGSVGGTDALYRTHVQPHERQGS